MNMVMRVCLVGLIMAVCVHEVTGSTMGGGDDRWYVVRRRCECEIVAAATVACKLGAEAISGWKDRGQLGRNGRGVDRKAYVEVSRVIQFVSAVQETVFIMMDTKKRCKLCGEGECDCEILISKRGSVIRVASDDRRVCGAIRVEEAEAGTRDRAMTKSKLWETYFRMNQLKALLMILRARWGGVRWERQWMKFMTDEWVTTGNMAEDDGWNCEGDG